MRQAPKEAKMAGDGEDGNWIVILWNVIVPQAAHSTQFIKVTA